MANIALSAGVRSNLLALQGTASMLTATQERLATGKRVNSALDNPTNFFTAQALSERATSLTSLQDGINTGIQTVKAANKGLDTITSLLKQAKSIAQQAKNGSATTAMGMTSGAALTIGGGDSATAVGIKNKTLASSLTTAAGVATGDTVTFTAEKNGVTSTYTHTVAGGDTVQSFIDGLNASGVATAKVEDNGTITFTSTNATDFDIAIESPAGGTAAADDKVLFGQTITENGAATNIYDWAGANTTSTAGNGQDYAAQYSDVMQAINDAVADSNYNGINLLTGNSSDKLTVEFDGASKSKIDVESKSFTTTDMALTPALDGTTADAAIANIDAALASVRGQQGEYGNKLNIMQTRLDFSKELSNMLEVGADNLTLADTNKEAANLLALQTRQSLSQSALSLANQTDQAVLQLLR